MGIIHQDYFLICAMKIRMVLVAKKFWKLKPRRSQVGQQQYQRNPPQWWWFSHLSSWCYYATCSEGTFFTHKYRPTLVLFLIFSILNCDSFLERLNFVSDILISLCWSYLTLKPSLITIYKYINYLFIRIFCIHVYYLLLQQLENFPKIDFKNI